MTREYEFEVAMTCGGCSAAIERILTRQKTNGVDIQEHNIDLESKKVKVKSGSLDANAVEEILKKCGKEVKFIAQRDV